MIFDAIRALAVNWRGGNPRSYGHLQMARNDCADALERVLSTMDRKKISDGYHTFGELYRERSALTAALGRMANDLIGPHSARIGYDAQPGFDGCRTVLYIQLPTGQVSWHFSDEDVELLAGIPRGGDVVEYDGHTTLQKYARVEHFAKGSW